ncbi:hypothetical protein [Roseivivax isoporae]|nr:hypothetical protein [Roseivivax isoporae]
MRLVLDRAALVGAMIVIGFWATLARGEVPLPLVSVADRTAAVAD